MKLAFMDIVLIVASLGYAATMLACSRREPRRLRSRISASPEGLFFVFLLPCLNEERVIANSLRRLLAIPGQDFAVMVIDDGSDDGTAAVVAREADDRVWLLRRTFPHAREGKGEALNAAIRHLVDSGRLAGRDPDSVIVAVVDADGRLEPHSVGEVGRYFADPSVGAVQIGVRINNRATSRLARMQDMEFVIYTEIFQRGRRHLGSVGLGGNGQFMRLSALRSLGPAPWSRSLTEDLDLGVRLLARGWRNEYCPTAAVHQQGVVELRRLIRQRSRWFQGHLQSWKLIGVVLTRTPRRARVDLLYHLTSPALLLIASLLTGSFALSVAGGIAILLHGGNPFGSWIASTYALTFLPALVFSFVYWLTERDNGVSVLRLIGFAHLYVCYGLMWYAAGWWAVGRTVRGRTSWAKTARESESAESGDEVAPAPLALPSMPVVATVPTGLVHKGVLTGAGGRVSPEIAITAGYAAFPAAGSGPACGHLAEVEDPSPAEGGQAVSDELTITATDGAGQTPQALNPSGRAHSRGPRRWRRSALVGGAVGCLIAAAYAASPLWSGHPRHSQWYQVFDGYGHVSLGWTGGDQVILLSPKPARTPTETHAALVISRGWYPDFGATGRVITLRQLRSGAAGRANPWEVGWFVWHYTSNTRFYALTLESNGWLLSKQDPAYPGGERFLASGRRPRFALGAAHTVQIVQIGNRITLSADGQLLARVTDGHHPYLTGAVGVYTEDAAVRFDHLRLRGLAAATH